MLPLNDHLSAMTLSGIRRFTALAAQTPGCISLALGEPDFPTPEPIKVAAKAALEENLTHYAPNRGLPELCREISRYETGLGYDCTPNQVIVTAGATEALYVALMGVVNPGDEVIVPTPAYPLYRSILTAAGAVMVSMPTREDGFQLTKERLCACITEKTRAIILNSPNNPTGAVYTRESLEAVASLVSGKPIWVVWDGVYNQLAEGAVPELAPFQGLQEQLLLCRSFSKPYAMTGWRLGYLMGPEQAMERLLLLHAALVAAMPTFLQKAAVTALHTDVSDMVGSYTRRRAYVCQRLDEMGLSYPKPEGAFYIYPEIASFGLSDEEFCTRLIQEAGVALVPGSCFEDKGHVRISCCCSQTALETGLDRLEQFLKAGSAR